MPTTAVMRYFTACGLIPSEECSQNIHSRLKEKILLDEPLVVGDSDSEDDFLEEGGIFTDSESASGEKYNFWL